MLLLSFRALVSVNDSNGQEQKSALMTGLHTEAWHGV